MERSLGGAFYTHLTATGFQGRVDFPGRTGSGILTIGGASYKLIDALGASGSTTGTDLQGIASGLGGNYALAGEIDASATSSWNSGLGFAADPQLQRPARRARPRRSSS